MTAASNAAQRMPLTRAGAVASELRQLIMSGELPAGSRLRQNEIAERFGVSTTPVREAFLALGREGLIRQDAHQGAIVFSPSVEDMTENYEIRAILESAAAEMAARRITEDELKELRDLLDEMRKAIRDDPNYHARVLNPKFHALISAASGRPKLAEMIQTLRDAAIAYHVFFVTPHPPADYAERVQREHEEIFEALAGGQVAKVGKLVKAHMNDTLKRILNSVDEKAKGA